MICVDIKDKCVHGLNAALKQRTRVLIMLLTLKKEEVKNDSNC